MSDRALCTAAGVCTSSRVLTAAACTPNLQCGLLGWACNCAPDPSLLPAAATAAAGCTWNACMH